MNVALSLQLLAYLLAFCVYIVIDVAAECRYQTEAAEHEELLDQLWDDRDPSAVTLEAVQTTEGMGSS